VTTADIFLGWQDFGAWLFGLEEKCKKAALMATDWAVDRLRWIRREISRRKGYPTGSRRDDRSGERMSVWDYLHSVPLEKLEYQQKPRGQHRDSRGWRYSGISIAWGLVERGIQERIWWGHWREQTDRLVAEIQYMFDHPPSAASVTTHGCQDCLCGQITAIRQEALA
jgi:hypothetical protein